jgi:uncharacterized protein
LSQVNLRFECQANCGRCCTGTSDPEVHGGVWLSSADVHRLANFYGCSYLQFVDRYCDEDAEGSISLKEEESGRCRFLTEDKRCKVHEAKPTQCRTYPFFPEIVTPEGWEKEKSFCPGIGQGKLYSAEEIKRLVSETDS